MGNVDFLNLEYILLRVFNIFKTAQTDSGVSVAPSDIPDVLSSILEFILVFGMVSSLILIIFLVYVHIRLLQVEHAGFHAMEEHDHEEHEAREAGGIEAEPARDDRFERIMQLASSPNESDWRRAILEADVLLSAALAQNGFVGPTVADQLRSANPIQMTTLDLAWKAHKVRNDVAHGGADMVLTERDTRATIDLYRRSLEELGAL